MSYVIAFFKNLSRAISFAIIGWNNPDYDHSYLFKLLEFKLRRMKYEIDNGYGEPNKATNQSLRICIRILNKLNNECYNYYSNKHTDKWGELEWLFTKLEHSALSTTEFTRVNAISEEEKDLERTEFLQAMEQDERSYNEDVDLLFRIMSKYHKFWWD